MKTLIFSAAALGAAILTGGIAMAKSPAPLPQQGAAQSAPAPGGPSRKVMKMDINRDGVVTRSEAMAAAGKKFDRMDTNRDGKLDSTEMSGRKDRRGAGRGRGRNSPDTAPEFSSDDNG